MGKPELVAECVAAMKSCVKVPVTVKHRIGIDDQDSYEELCNFIDKAGGILNDVHPKHFVSFV